MTKRLCIRHGGIRTPEVDQRQREERHTQQEEEVRIQPRTMEGVGQTHQTVEHPVELELYRHAIPATCTPHEH